MTASRCYLDFNATAPLRPAAREACVAALNLVGNASSVHREGRDVRRVVETARERVARFAGCAAEHVIFTSGGTEAANLLLSPSLQHARASFGVRRLLIGATEHACVLQGHRFASDRVEVLPVDANGIIDLAVLADRLAADSGSPVVLVLQAANNETGVLQPVQQAAAMVRAAGGLLVCDAVQAAGRIDLSPLRSCVDALFLSGHKLGAPKGVGAVVLGEGVSVGPLLRGGGQERGFRSGTENVAGIAGFGAAADAAMLDDNDKALRLRDRLEDGLATFGDAVVFGAAAPRLPNTTCFSVEGLSAETALMALDLAGFAISSGSACSSGKVSRSHVLEAMGVRHHLSARALRVSVGWSSTEVEVDRFLDAFSAIRRRIRNRPVQAAA